MSSRHFFCLNGQFYEQTDGVATGSSLSPVIANFFMEDFKEKLLKRATHKPLFNQIRRRQLRELAPWTRKAGRLPPSPQQHTAKHEGRDT